MTDHYTDNHADNHESATDSQDLLLAREIRNLDPEMSPGRNLWLGIERRIQDYPQKSKKTSTDWRQPIRHRSSNRHRHIRTRSAQRATVGSAVGDPCEH